MQPPHACRQRLRAFSLAELVVSIGVLILMFSLAGQVFTVTMKSTGQAIALSDVTHLMRIFEQNLREDLRYVEPGQSLIVLQGNPVNAYWTQKGKDADGDGDPSNGYPHFSDPSREDANEQMIAPRADILMIFTARKATSFADPNVTSNLQQVVYGHADMGEYVPNSDGQPFRFDPGPFAYPVDDTTGYPLPPDPNDDSTVSPVPSEQWHLARRSALLVPTIAPPSPPPLPPPPTPFTTSHQDEQLLQSARDVFFEFNYENLVLTPGKLAAGPWYLPAIFDTANFGTPLPWTNPPAFNPAMFIARSWLDPTPPATLAIRLGHYFAPNCASFKVEWALDPRSEFVDGRLDRTTEIYWFDPGRFDPDDPEKHPLEALQKAIDAATDVDLLEDLDGLLRARTRHPDKYDPDLYSDWEYSLRDRFQGDFPDKNLHWNVLSPDGRPNLVVFGAARWNPVDEEVVPEDIFPVALRITIDLYDDARRLDRPIRHVMVVPVGS